MAVEASAARRITTTRSSGRSIYVFTAVLFVIVTLVGFAPTSLGLIADTRSGARPGSPLELHMHAISMWAWLLLLTLAWLRYLRHSRHYWKGPLGRERMNRPQKGPVRALPDTGLWTGVVMTGLV